MFVPKDHGTGDQTRIAKAQEIERMRAALLEACPELKKEKGFTSKNNRDWFL